MLNREHLNLRIERVHVQDRQLVLRVMARLARMAKNRALPNCRWYLTVWKDRTPVAHICGQGVLVATILSGDMFPIGQRVY